MAMCRMGFVGQSDYRALQPGFGGKRVAFPLGSLGDKPSGAG